MDSSVDPCEDFYRYACGGFINQTTVPENELSVNYQIMLEINMRNWLKRKLQNEIDPNEPRHLKLVKNLYNICMNECEYSNDTRTSVFVTVAKQAPLTTHHKVFNT